MQLASKHTPFKVGAHALGNHCGLTWCFSTGVMRFLQTEWHRHERDRNAWDIERAEMKSRIGRLEGECKTNKRLHDSLGKHVKILESALKKEREKVKALTKGEKVDFGKDAKELAREELKSIGKGPLLVILVARSYLTQARIVAQKSWSARPRARSRRRFTTGHSAGNGARQVEKLSWKMRFRNYLSRHANDSYSARSKRSAFDEPRLPEPTTLSASSSGSLRTATAATETAAAPKQYEHGARKLGPKPSSNAADI